MEQPKLHDLRRALDLFRGIYETNDFESFVARLLAALPKLVDSEVTSYNRMRFAEAQSENWVAPKEVNTPARARAWERVMHEHPNAIHYRRTDETRALRVSDFLSSRQFRSMALYNEFYRDFGVEDCLTLAFPRLSLAGEAGALTGIGLHRGSRFSEYEKSMIEYLGPHLCQAYFNALAVDRLIEDTALYDRALACAGRAIVALQPDRRMRLSSAFARKLMKDYFGASAAGDRLPEAVELWVRRHEAGLRQQVELPVPRRPLVIDRSGKRLTIRLVSEAGQSILMFEEQRASLELSSLVSLGLTGREAQVLATVAGGKTLQETADALGISPRTAQTHLHTIYRKLNVKNRAAAVAAAFRASQDACPAVETRDDRDLRAYLAGWLAAIRSEASNVAQSNPL